MIGWLKGLFGGGGEDIGPQEAVRRINQGALLVDVREPDEFSRGHAPGALDEKTKELIAMAIGVANRCDACLGFHAKALVRLGATPEEFREMLGVAVYMGGGPSLMYAANAMAAYEEFAAATA